MISRHLLILTLVASSVAAAGRRASPAYEHFISGSSRDVERMPRFGLALRGGGEGDLDESMTWLARRAGGGDFVVIRASGDGEYNDYIMGLASLDSVETIVLNDRAASSDPFVLDRVRGAEAVFFGGGDQSRYVKFFKDTPLGDLFQELLEDRIPMGGTSAGLAILGEFSFSAMEDTVTSDEALANPFDSKVTLERDFLDAPFMRNIITDTHFMDRARLGRLIVFLARLRTDGWAAAPVGLGVDESTALLVEESGVGKVVGLGTVTVVTSRRHPQTCRRGKALTWHPVALHRLSPGESLDLEDLEPRGGRPARARVVRGKLTTTGL